MDRFIDNGLINIAQQFSGLPMASLIGAPLNASIRANAQADMASNNFLLDSAYFQRLKNEKEENLKPIMLASIENKLIQQTDTNVETGS